MGYLGWLLDLDRISSRGWGVGSRGLVARSSGGGWMSRDVVECFCLDGLQDGNSDDLVWLKWQRGACLDLFHHDLALHMTDGWLC